MLVATILGKQLTRPNNKKKSIQLQLKLHRVGKKTNFVFQPWLFGDNDLAGGKHVNYNNLKLWQNWVNYWFGLLFG